MYSEKVMEHFEHPRNVGEIPDASGTGTVGTIKAGAEALDGLPPVKMHCSLLAEQAIHAAVEDYQKKHPRE